MLRKIINVLIGICIVLIFYFEFTREIIIMFFMAGIIFYILKPCRDFLCKKGYSIRFVSFILISFITTGLILMVIFMFPSVLNQDINIEDRLKEIDDLLAIISKQFENITRIEKVNAIITEIYGHLNKELHAIGIRIIKMILAMTGKIFFALAIPIITYYMLSDFENTIGRLTFIIPVEYKKDVVKICRDIDKVLRKYILGQIILSSMMGLTISLVLYIAGVKYAIYFGIINGIFNLIPYVGPIIASIPVIFVAFSKSIYTGIIVMIFLMVIQQVEGDIVSPKVIGKFVEFHPLLILFLLLIGGGIGGIFGMFLIVPIAIASKVTFEEIDYILLNRKK